MNAELINNTNDDLSVANIARTSFSKWSTEFTYRADVPKGSDEGLVHYLANHRHISPFFHQRFTFVVSPTDWESYLHERDLSDLMGFVWQRNSNSDGDYYEVRGSFYGWVSYLRYKDNFNVKSTLVNRMPVSSAAYGLTCESPILLDLDTEPTSPKFTDASIRITAPIFVLRQLFTHRMFATNEVSRRYVNSEPQFFAPTSWRLKPEGSIKQGSSTETHDRECFYLGTDSFDEPIYGNANEAYYQLTSDAEYMYNQFLAEDIAPEQARMLLPQSMLSQVIFTGSLHDWAKVYHLRTDSHAQIEIQDLLHLVDSQLTEAYPDLWEQAKQSNKD